MRFEKKSGMGETVFRIVLVAGITVMTLIALWYKVRAHSQGASRDGPREDRISQRALRLLAAVWIATIGACVIKPEWLTWSSMPVPTWSRWIGVAAWLVSLGLLVWTYHVLGPNLSDTVETRSGATLVTNGPYRIVRHPMYSSFLGIALGLMFLTANWMIGAGGISVWLLMIVRTPQEELALQRAFGDDYRNYSRKTGRFLPRFRSST